LCHDLARSDPYKKMHAEVAIMKISGIITTILGKSATNSKVAGRERRVHHSKSLPLPFIGEGLFFALRFHSDITQVIEYKPKNRKVALRGCRIPRSRPGAEYWHCA
jgi:hypothetical protein